jgi:sugar transferase (PEP-CTERM system associated)
MLRVFSHYFPIHVVQRIFLDFVLLLVAVIALITFKGQSDEIDWGLLLFSALTFSFIMVVINFSIGLYRPVDEDNSRTALARTVLAAAFALPMAYGMVLVLPWSVFPSLSMQFSVVILPLVVQTLRALVNRGQASSLFAPRILVLGVGEKAAAVQRTLLHPEQGRVKVQGFFAFDRNESPAVDPREILAADDLAGLVRRLRIDEIIVAAQERSNDEMPLRELLDCKLSGVGVFDLTMFYERVQRQVRLESLHASQLIYGEGFRQTLGGATAKRCFDLAASTLLLAASAPIMILTALLIALEDRGPVFYRQERVGLGSQIFKVIKFRSMHPDAEKDGQPRWASPNDDRMTRIGKVIRKLRIDELPQLFNVLKDDMSLVGPRPERPFFVDQLARELPFYNLRHHVKPGITGWAQVRYQYGSSVNDAVQKLQYDLYYIKNHSLVLDTLVLLETVRVVLTGEGAH